MEDINTNQHENVDSSMTNSDNIKTDSPQVAKNKEALIEAMIKHRAIVSDACKAAGLSRNTYYRFCEDDKAFKKACLEASEIALDEVESKLHSGINEGNMTAIIFYLKTKGKKRGYVEGIINWDIPMDDENKQFMQIGDTVLGF